MCNGVTNNGQLVLTLPWPPSVNRYWRHVAVGHQIRAILSREAREYKNAVWTTVMAQRAAQGILWPVSVDVLLTPPDKRTRDIDNYNKGLFDALTEAGVWQGDHLIK